MDAQPTLLASPLVPSRNTCPWSHNNLTTLHGELSSLPSLSGEAAQDCR